MYLFSGAILRALRMMTLPPRGHPMSFHVYQVLCKPSVDFAPFYSFLVGPGRNRHSGLPHYTKEEPGALTFPRREESSPCLGAPEAHSWRLSLNNPHIPWVRVPL